MVYLSALLPFVSLVCAATIPAARDVHDHQVRSALPDRWYHDDDHPAHSLFKRQSPTPTATNSSGPPQVGSPAWTAAYPSDTPDLKALPKAWTDALNAAVQAGKIPNIPQSTQANPDTNPTYPNKLDPTSPEVCSGTYQCRGPDTIWDAPNGTLGLGFDDGPLPPSPTLYAFLRQNNLHATHFFIGTNILQYWQNFNIAFHDNQDDIAVHTWTHPYMTTLSNEQVLAELAWTVQIIYDSAGGRLPRYWRPPYGDTDVRVTAIAKQVLGMTAIVWNHEYAVSLPSAHPLHF
ncbi:hypothetical protein EWM64_g8388 [Hericium alpestre]|uniref:chitin deacetylase n=1 Tax=Hericium alpestre TaxID=135208 RepID=A0A4Y9ZMY1_9AGAM|nr:hypothetical protein EWM64_g8388 [Hericium alpestre]